jgi:serine/threonine protein kinase
MRVGLQLVRATAAAAFYGLTHRAVQPSNLMIVPGQAPDGGWPFVKLLNFGLAGLELHSGSAEAREIAPSVAPAFGSPEQLLNRQIDFRSEIYSIGATMCFLLTGAVPIAVGAAKARFGARRLPELRGAPRSMRRLLVQMLRENPENRPQDPVVFEQEMRRCLTKIERRQAIGHRLGIPLAAVIAHRPKPKKEAPTPLAQVLRGILAGVALLMAATVLGGYFFPHVLPLTRRSEQIGVPIGVPEERATPAAQIVASNPGIIPPPPPTAANQNPPLVENQSQPPAPEAQPPTAPDSPTVADSSSITSGQTNAMAERLEPMPPAKGPDTQSDPEENSAQGRATTSTESSESNALSKKETSASKLSREPTRKHARVAKTLPRGENPYRPQSRGRWVRARWVGTTPDGRAILRLPSGRVVVASRRSDNNGMFPPPARRRILTDRPDFYGPPPETQYPPGYPPYD